MTAPVADLAYACSWLMTRLLTQQGITGTVTVSADDTAVHLSIVLSDEDKADLVAVWRVMQAITKTD